MDIFILELVSNQLTVPVKIYGRQQQEETCAIRIYTRRTCAGLQVHIYLQGKMRSWVACCFMETFILIVMSNLLHLWELTSTKATARVDY